MHCLGTQQQSEEARAHFASRHKQAIEDYEQAAYAYHRSNLSTGKVYAGSASRIDSCVADLDKDIRSLTNIINTLHDKVTSAGESAGRVGNSLSVAQVLATILPSIEAARSTLDGMPSRDAITKETATITHCTTAQRDMLASVKDREYKAGRRAAEDEFGSHLAPASRRESRDSRRNSSGRNRSRDRSGRSSGNSGRGSGTRRTSEY